MQVPHLFHSCYGVAFSPGNLVLAVARTFDTALLNPMYEQRALKACVEFLWVGGQQLDDSSDFHADFEIQAFPGFPERELINWESNILWSLNHLEYLEEPLVVWDVVVALLAFKQSVPKYVRHILMKWLQTYCRESPRGSISILTEISESVSMLSLRLLNLINIISRHVILEERKAYNFNAKCSDAEEMVSAEELNLWKELIENCETELRIRLVGCSFSAARSTLSRSSTKDRGQVFWNPSGIAQMEQWVAVNNGCGNDNVKVLGNAIKKFKKSRCQSMDGYVLKEQCSFCTALVPFESAEDASCQGDEESSETGERLRHKLLRCAVSMRVCPATPMWYCMSCQRRALNLAPKAFFSMHKCPLDFKSFSDSLSPEDWTVKPFCPFCGILLQRLLPEFLLSASPV
ncbi:hypothetical protein Leryth_004665 [Lithospermum erythrorhizon]|nr:hypothetical protein Leryth_004665 [Lithospermum erythrorhizon]